VIAAAGDIACDPTNSNFNGGNGTSNACAQKATAGVISSIDPAAVLVLGDNQYYCGGYKAFQQSYDTSWGKFKGVTRPSVGNHEYLGSGGTDCDPSSTAAGYFKYFGSAAGSPGAGYYSFDLGSWHLIALNSNCTQAGGCGPTSPQGKWLAADLAAHSDQCLLAYWHIPLNTSSAYAATNSYQFWKQLHAAHADVILNGHAHDYERFAPQAPPATSQTNAGILDPANGIVQFVVGTGGANHTSLASANAPNTVINDKAAFGVLQMTLHATSYDFKFVPVSGSTFTDSGAGVACHNTSAGSPPPPTGGSSVTLVRDQVASGSTANLNVALSPASKVGDTLVATIALNAGSSAAVTSVTDSSGGSWTRGPIGFLTGTNSRVEIWYRLSAPAVSSVTIALSASKSVSANISEWAGSGWALDTSAGGGTPSATTASTPSVTTTGATDLVIGAVNYPAVAASSLDSRSFKSLRDFNSGTGVHGRAAYAVTSSVGSTTKTTWSLSTSTAGGGAILALKTSGNPLDKPPTVPAGLVAHSVTSSEVELAWRASTDGDSTPLAGYRVYRAGVEVGAVDAATTSYRDTGLKPATTYTYSVSAFDTASPPNESAQSPTVSVATRSSSTDGTTTLTPIADTYASSAQPTVSYGAQPALYVDADGMKQSYLKFNLSGITGTVTSATLRIHAGSSQNTGYAVFAVADGNWGESRLNWNNRPAFATSSSGSSGPASSGTWTTVSLPPSLVQRAAGGVLSLGLSTTSKTNLKLTSKEAGAGTTPQLVLAVS
jgi:hypothetical protein